MRYKIIIGLGNPLKEYFGTYHNVGFMALDSLTTGKKFKKHGSFEYVKSGGTVFVKPLTFMNESGIAVAEALRFFKSKPKDMLLIHDESDIRLGEHKLSCDSGSAGHNGVKSIISSLGTQEFCRLRIGIRPSESVKKAGDMVLKKISKAELGVVQEGIKKALEKTLEIKN